MQCRYRCEVIGVRHKEIGRQDQLHLLKASPGQDYSIYIAYTYSTLFFIVTGLYYPFPRKLFGGTECQSRMKYFSAFSYSAMQLILLILVCR